MSLLAPLLGWTRLPPWALELLAIGMVAGGVHLWWHIHNAQEVAKGIAQQVEADQEAGEILQAQADKATNAAILAAQLAENARKRAENALQDYIADHDLVTDRLCGAPPEDGPARHLSATTQANPGHAASSPAPFVVQQVPAPDRWLASDRQRMLAALAALADDTSNNLREWQSR